MLVSVSVLLNFKMSQHTTFPTKRDTWLKKFCKNYGQPSNSVPGNLWHVPVRRTCPGHVRDMSGTFPTKTNFARPAISMLWTRSSGSCFLDWIHPIYCARQLDDEIRSLKYKEEYSTATSRPTLPDMRRSTIRYWPWRPTDMLVLTAGHVCVTSFGGIKEPSLKTAVLICESLDCYSVDFQACTSYLTSMVQKALATKWVNVAATVTEDDGVKLKNQDGTDQCLPPSRYSAGVYNMLSPNRRSGSGKTART